MDDEKIGSLFWKPYNPEILRLCDGRHSILDIKNEVGLSYKSIFYRIKELNKAGMISIENSGSIGEKSIIKISYEYQNFIKKQLSWFQLSENEIKSLQKNEDKKKSTIEVLSLLKKYRWIDSKSLQTYNRKFWENEKDSHKIPDIPQLVNFGLIKERMELTKKGKKFLEQNKL